ncbi:Translocation protein sec66 [Vanrija pseudolonga]|uniref:Translocation protein sec66 n=1 Tax=Vanrija pseudolonga TaxID=143232 RepID=A0AAF0YKB6_9TREE|nr:Translocation protein sec66 [Vanrija pseudolonga]
MATSLAVPIAYITVLVTSLAIFSRIYRRRRAAEKTSFEPWFPAHPARDIYITLLGAEPPVPESMLKSALLVRATADVKRIWRIKEDKQTLQGLHQRGLVGDDTMARFAAAEKELEAEIVDVVSEANTFRNGWGTMIFATASEMAHAERTRDTVINIGKVKALEEKRLSLRAKLLGLPVVQAQLAANAQQRSPGSVSPVRSPSPATAANVATTPPVVESSSPIHSGASTPSKSATTTHATNTPSKKALKAAGKKK